MKLNRLPTLIFLLIASTLHGQVQTIRGTITDQDSNYPMIGVTVVVLESDPLLGAVTDIEGRFEIAGVPVGRLNLTFSFVGYKSVTLNQQLLEIGKELVLNVGLEEDIQTIETLTITAQNQRRINNEAAVVSIRTFDVEETRRYAGSRNDIARMASNFAGVSNADDSRNDIVVRGNSPVNLLWRLDGLDIPSPNHYNTLGTTGGPVSMLNNNNLSNSDFITSAFPADYGNTISGVFDLQMKKGNGFTSEYMGQVGFNGFELGAEGPFSKNTRSSYMVNYRYSTLGVFKALGVDFGTGTAVPQYQDLTFSLDLPTKKAGSFKLFGLGGLSEIHFAPVDEEDSEGNLYTTADLKNNADMGLAGLKHTYYFNPKTYMSTSAGVSYQYSAVVIDSTHNNTPGEIEADILQNQSQTKYSINTKWVTKFDAKSKLEIGANLNYYDVNFQDSIRDMDGSWIRYTDAQGGTLLSQVYSQYQFRFSDQLRIISGLHVQHLTLTDQVAVEPRLGVVFNPRLSTALSLGYGLHSQMQPLIVSYFQFEDVPDDSNLDLGFTKSHHFSMGIKQGFRNQFNLKVEGYYQHLFNVPIERVSSSYSILNSGTSFGFEIEPDLINEGLGKNYGVELTLEKNFNKSYYFLLTTSLFESKYQGSDRVWRNTAYNNRYIANLLGGTEFKVGKNGTFTTDLKLTFSGGRFYSPIDLDESIAAGETVYVSGAAYSLQYDPYFRTDFKIGYRMNMKKVSQEWLIDFQNLFNTENIFEQFFNPQTDTIQQRNQLGLFIVPQYRILF